MRFNLRQAFVAMSLIAIGLSALPIAIQYGRQMGGVAILICWFCFFGLPTAGVGYFFHRPYAGFILGIVLGLAIPFFL